MSAVPTTRKKRHHWADNFAQQLIRRTSPSEGALQPLVCASGISPSGKVHVGNFREIITTDLVHRALRTMGIRSHFLLFWDDYDALRKVPEHTTHTADTMEVHLRKPLAEVPPLKGVEGVEGLKGVDGEATASYARQNETAVETVLPTLGMYPRYIYQHQRYRACTYAPHIAQALNNRESIREILNQHRHEPLPEHWWPISVYSSATGKDTTTVLRWDGARYIDYRCNESGREERIDIFHTGSVKLQWRVDWPARWSKENIDFEPAGKDHHSPGGSFDTAEEIVRKIYNTTAPLSPRYDFIGIKGWPGKMSSSSGTTISLAEILEVYQPEVVRYLFAGTRPQVEFFISFDHDVIKIYEDYDRCERIYFGLEKVGEERREKERRIYELSQIEESVPPHPPPSIAFRHLCNIIQIFNGDTERALQTHPPYLDAPPAAQQILQRRAQCASRWVSHYAPPQFQFSLTAPMTEIPPEIQNSKGVLKGLQALYNEIAANTLFNTKDTPTALHNALYTIARTCNIEPKTLFTALYRILIARDQGPRLAHFLSLIGKERLLKHLAPFVH